MNFVLIGAPLSGKGTIGDLLSKKYQIPHISMGDLLRNCATGDNKYSRYLSEHIASGKLINDDLVKVILEDRLSKKDCKNGYVLDGYPRNVEQAEKLDTFTNIDKAIYVTVSKITMIDRLRSRIVCSNCYTSYNMNTYKNKVCEKCSAPLIKREDDKEDILIERVKIYNANSYPIISKYSRDKKLVTISNEGDINLVFNELIGKIENDNT
mgnify:CR=1 FL=1